MHINCLVTQSTIKMRKRVQNIYVLSGHFLSLPHLLKCPQRKYMSHAIGFVNGMVASHLLCHSGTINRHSLNGALLS
ncbi:hypothetical protein C3F40_06860 [Escherichia coli]|uniref:Uncharacterized protein n=1 Tax=Escherichia coli TaxID=562 RepID=A0A7U5YX73_ECOLX|nr:hypothetical protein C3F40_06860 [Escherichia coli]